MKVRRCDGLGIITLSAVLSAVVVARAAPEPETASPEKASPAVPAVAEASTAPAAQAAAAVDPRPEIEVREQITAAVAVRRDIASPGSKLSERLILPSGWLEIGGQLTFVTSPAMLGGRSLRFTDLGLLRLVARRAFGERLELRTGAQLLIKQPPGLDEPALQGGDLGARIALLPALAVGFDAGAGPLLGNPGMYIRLQPGIWWKPAIERRVRFELGASVSSYALHHDERQAPTAWLHELALNAEGQLGYPGGGAIVGFGYRLPFAKSPDGTALDPSPQLDFYAGGILAAGSDDSWQLYAVYAVIDRGEPDEPATTLPIIDGGFDQQQFVFGVQHRFE